MSHLPIGAEKHSVRILGLPVKLVQPKSKGDIQMFENIDIYCERLDASFWAEPVNALTNIAFLLAAWSVWQRARQLKVLSFEVRLLIVLMASIGIGSGIFHTFATGWARFIDVLPILLFQMTYLFVYLHRLIKIQIGFITGILALYLIVVIIARQFPHILNGSLIYAPVLLVLLLLGIHYLASQRKEPYLLLVAVGVFMLSITCRTFDMTICPYFPLGIHFMWHILNSLALYLLMRGYLANIPIQQEHSQGNNKSLPVNGKNDD